MSRSPTKKGLPARRVLGYSGRGQPYLWLRPGRVGTDGIERGAIWIIKDRGSQRATGCGVDQSAQALEALEAYKLSLHTNLTQKHLRASQVLIADVLGRYLDFKFRDVPEGVPAPPRLAELAQRVATLLEWWGERTLDDIDDITCAAYAKSRTGVPWKTHSRKIEPAEGETPRRLARGRPTQQRVTGTATPRRELEVLRAAVEMTKSANYCTDDVKVLLPEKSPERERWLTVSEAAKMVKAAWRKREVQRGEKTDRYPWRHLVKFILVGLRSGTRATAICQASFLPEIGKPWVELFVDGAGRKAAKFHRKALGGREAVNKKYPTVRLPDNLAVWLHRWHHVDGCRYVVEWRGGPVGSTKKAFANLAYELGYGDDVLRHTLRHTAATWGMQSGVDVWQLAGYLGMTVETLERRYGHHSPDHMEDAREALGSGRRARRKRAETGGERTTNSTTESH